MSVLHLYRFGQIFTLKVVEVLTLFQRSVFLQIQVTNVQQRDRKNMQISVIPKSDDGYLLYPKKKKKVQLAVDWHRMS